MKCVVSGCRNKLDSDGNPVEYCDYQQGRCPMQRQNRNPADWFVYTLLAVALVGAFVVTWFNQ